MLSLFHPSQHPPQKQRGLWLSPSQRIRRFLNTPLASRGLWGWALLPLLVFLSLIVGVVAYLKRLFIKRAPPPFPVVCVGNVAMGGAGKSPVVQYLAQEAYKNKFKVIIITKGYKKSSHQTLGDESFMLKKNLDSLGVAVQECSNRSQAIQTLTEQWNGSPTCVLLDDGLQSVSCPRTQNLVLWDPDLLLKAPGAPFPLGPYREGLFGFFQFTLRHPTQIRLWSRCFDKDFASFKNSCQTALGKFNLTPNAHKDFIVIKKCQLVSPCGKIIAPDQLPPGPLGGLCGIGNPDVFFSDVAFTIKRELHMKIALGDHGKLAMPILKLLESLDGLIMTEKDWTRWQDSPLLFHWKKSNLIWILNLNVTIKNWDGQLAPFHEFLNRK